VEQWIEFLGFICVYIRIQEGFKIICLNLILKFADMPLTGLYPRYTNNEFAEIIGHRPTRPGQSC